MILIFDLIGGFTDMLKDICSIYNFTLKYKYNFTIRYATCRSIDNLSIYSKYSVDNLFDIQTFKYNQYYIEYSKFIDNINEYNTHEYRLWENNDVVNEGCIINSIINYIINTDKTYIIISGTFWYYTNLNNFEQMSDIFKTLIPSNKIMKELNKNIINEKYNCIHYRYEDDWIPYLKERGSMYVIPPIDELVNNLPFKNIHKIYICTSNIESLYSKNLLYNNIEMYDNIIYKKKNNLNYDENGFLDLLIMFNCQEFYGNSISGFTILSNVIKKSENYYNRIPYFYKYNTI